MEAGLEALPDGIDALREALIAERAAHAETRAGAAQVRAERASDQALMRMVWRVCKRADIRHLSPHQLRHGFANRFLRESGRDLKAAGRA